MNAEFVSRGRPETPDRAVAVCLDGTRVLVVRRLRSGKEYAVLPGGVVEPGDRRAHYFLVDVPPDPPRLGGPEAEKASPGNRYEPQWIDADDLSLLVPQEAGEIVRRALAHPADR